MSDTKQMRQELDELGDLEDRIRALADKEEEMGIFAWIADRTAHRMRSPTAPECAAGLLEEIGDRWCCWRLRSETDRELMFRVQLHLHTIVLAVEDDLVRLDQLSRSALGPKEGCDD